MKLTKQQIAIIFVGFVVVVGGYFLFKWLFAKKAPPAPVAISVWGTDDPALIEIIKGFYGAYRPNVTVTYRQIPASSYNETLLNALAAGEGPDVYEINNHAILREKPRLVAADPGVFPPALLKSSFPPAALDDLAVDGKVWGLPLYFDTLALFSNRDMLNQAGIVYPPKTWSDFVNAANSLKLIDAGSNQVRRAGAALGGAADSVMYAPDIVQAIMLQNGATMVDGVSGVAKFNENPGVQALNFYLQFAQIGSPNFTWSPSGDSSRAAFAAGKVAMIFDYRSALAEIKKKSPFLNVQISEFPQVASGTGSAVAFPSYLALAVSKQSRVQPWGWDFVNYAAMTPQVVKSYSETSGRPAALLSVVNDQLKDAELGLFARQALVARSWREPDEVKVFQLFNDAISSVLTGQLDSARALKIAADEITNMLQRQAKGQ